MSDFFILLYNYFQRHKRVLYVSLIVCIMIMGYFASLVKFEENVGSFFPDTDKDKMLNKVFKNLRVKDKIFIMISSFDTLQRVDEGLMQEAAEQLKVLLMTGDGSAYINDIILRIDDNLLKETRDFVYNHLPLFLTENDYLRMDSLFAEGAIASIMHRNYSNLLSPAGVVLKDFIIKDPLGLGSNALKRLEDFRLDSDFEQVDGYIFSPDESTLLMMLTPTYDLGSTGKNEKLISAIEHEIKELSRQYPQLNVEFYGGPTVSVYNARQIKSDSLKTSSVALIIIVVFISLVFKRKRTIPLIIAPVLFGGLFAVSMIGLIKGSISAIAVGAGSIVLGIALSYSIHMVVHQSHVDSVRRLIRELTYPLTVGSFTTIGAFVGLLFTRSDLLRDFGLFAAMTLVGTTLFCLVYLPHFLTGDVNKQRGPILKLIERFNSYRFDKNKGLTGAFFVIIIICAFTSRKVGFDPDMMKLNYEPKHVKETGQKLDKLTQGDNRTILFVSVGKNEEEAVCQYNKTNKELQEFQEKGMIKDFASADYFLIPTSEQQKRLQRWNDYWTAEKKERVKVELEEQLHIYGFRPGTFSGFYGWWDTDFSFFDFDKERKNPLLSNWEDKADGLVMFITQVQPNHKNKEELYDHFNNVENVIVFDRAYFTGKWIAAIHDDFYLVLFISSFLIFFTLLISYGRIELTLISFAPMFFTWIIIIGIMGITGIEFNIINIILSTFIFGIGDDFSIFVTDGLQNRYRTGKKVLNGHKTAIFFSAFTIIVGMGVLIFAKHPALKSISLMSIPGMIVVVLSAYTISPFLFRLFISSPAAKGSPPYTLGALLITLFVYGTFLIGCILLRIIMMLLYIIPGSKSGKQYKMCVLIMHTCRFICNISFILKKKIINQPGEQFHKSGIIIANHQSFTDILFLLSLTPKILMVTNSWVWRSPFFGAVIRYAGYFYAGEGYEDNITGIKQKLDEGYSVVVFPEGTRSMDGKIKRFHKGAFYLSEKLRVDIIPVILYGTGMVVSKVQPFYLKNGMVVVKILPRIVCDDMAYGDTYQVRTKNIRRYFESEYEKLYLEFNTPDNPYFYKALVKNYIFKGPVEEWYVRIKVKMENEYRLFDRLIPREGRITDIGCGYGMLPYMLMMLSYKRHILGLDYDCDKIKVAERAYLRSENVKFVCADAVNYDLPKSNVFILNDVLHYLKEEEQSSLLKKCIEKLLPGGMIIVRDGDASQNREQKVTRLTEILSTRVFKFNKTRNKLHFLSSEQLYQVAEKYNMQVKSFRNDKFTSNTLFLFQQKTD